MVKKIFSILFFSGLIFSESASAQCVSITCPGDTAVVADSSCSAIVSYSAPVTVNVCSAPDSTLYAYTGVIDTFFVPAGVTSITIKAWGAKGGGPTGGLGAYIQGDVSVTPGDTLKILVGQVGLTDYGYGGGGGSFIATINDVPLVVAGGGGGAEHNDSFPGYDALLTNDGMNVELALGGVAGGGGELGNPNTSGCGWSGSGGGGFFADGGTVGDGGGSSFVNGGAGGIDPTGNCVVAGFGGFGGGGAGGNPGGGGGGYSGGAGGANIGLVPNRGGGGGGSFNSGTNQVNTAGVSTSNGAVQISYLGAPLYVTMIEGLGSGSSFPVGVTTETYVVTDSITTPDTCSFTITVLDTLAPDLTCPGSLVVCTDIVTGIGATAIDLCSTTTVDYTFSGATTGSGSGDASGSIFNIGSTLVTYTALDTNGNSSSCAFTVDNLTPLITVNSSETLVCVYDGLVTLTGTPSGGTWSGTGVSGSNFDPTVSGIGSHTLSYNYTDTVSGCSNSDSLSITVDACASLFEGAEASNWKVYPNPSSDLVTVEFDSNYENLIVDITQANGQLVRTENFNGQSAISLSIRDLENGIYFLVIKADQSEKIVRVIKN